MLPELDIRRVLAWAGRRIPPQFVEEVRMEVDTTPTSITILECRPPWDSTGTSLSWTRLPIARLEYKGSDGTWTLYWRDRNSKFHLYETIAPTRSIDDLLNEISADPAGIFWG